MNVRIKPYLEMWGNERDWDRVEIVTLAHTQPHHTSPFAKEKFLFLSNKNLRKNLHLLGKFMLQAQWFGSSFLIGQAVQARIRLVQTIL